MGVRSPPPQKRGISAILARYRMKKRQKGCDAPLCDTIWKRYCAIWGDISHWAAKGARGSGTAAEIAGGIALALRSRESETPKRQY